MKPSNFLTSLAVALSLTASAAFADSHINSAISARQALMGLYGFSLGTLGGMAQGKIDYDADAAQNAAANLVALTALNQSAMWPQGSDNAAIGGGVTRALPALWENFPDVVEKSMAVHTAAVAMDAAAGGGLDSLQGAMRALGQSCGACHRSYRGR